MLWDIFCQVIDNHGDLGVCWRLASQLAVRGERVRLWANDPSALAWMAPQGQPGVEVIRWLADAPERDPGDRVIEAFGCEPGARFVAALAAKTQAEGRQPVWINLEYLSAEPYAERNHGLPSPVLSGPAAGLTKRFFYPGFTAGTGGLLRESDLAARQAGFDRQTWSQSHGIAAAPGALRVTLFCYEPGALGAALGAWAGGTQRTHLMVTAGRAKAAVEAVRRGPARPRPMTDQCHALTTTDLPLLAQTEFDHLLWSSDLNLVRGEDSLVRALWAGKPLVWQLYPQRDNAHHAKLAAFLDWLQAPASLRDFHLAWNGLGPALKLPSADHLAEWSECVLAASKRLWSQPDLVSQLLQFAGPRATA